MGTKIGVVIHRPLVKKLFSPVSRKALEALGEVRWTDSDKPITAAQAVELLADCEIGIGSWNSPRPNAELMAGCPRLRLWEHVAGTVKAMFGPHLDGRNLTIASCAPAIAECVAEYTLGALIVGLKQALPNSAANRSGPSPKPAGSRTLRESTVGIVGASNVGRRAMAHLRPLGARILLFDPFVSAEEARSLGAEKVEDLVDLCRRSHAVSLHAPAIPATEKMLGAPHFQAMPDDGVFVNTARGMSVDEAALIEELQKGRLFAFIDVTDPEPAAPDNPLRSLPNCVLTSHTSGGPDDRLGEQAVADVAAFLRGGKPKMAVTADMLSRLA